MFGVGLMRHKEQRRGHDAAEPGREQGEQAMADDQERILIDWCHCAFLGSNQQQPVPDAVCEVELFKAKSQGRLERDAFEVDVPDRRRSCSFRPPASRSGRRRWECPCRPGRAVAVRTCFRTSSSGVSSGNGIGTGCSSACQMRALAARRRVRGGGETADDGRKPGAEGVQQMVGRQTGPRLPIERAAKSQGHIADAENRGSEPDLPALSLIAAAPRTVMPSSPHVERNVAPTQKPGRRSGAEHGEKHDRRRQPASPRTAGQSHGRRSGA